MVIKSLKAPWAQNKKRPFMKASAKALRAFGEDRSGTFAVAFAGALMALLFCAGAAIDMSRYYTLKKAAHNAADAAVLAVSTRTDLNTISEKETFAQSIFDLEFSSRYPYASNTTITLTEPANSPTTMITIAPLYNTALLELFGIPTLPINFTSEATYTNLEAVLVLDNTGSMTPPQFRAMQEAAQEFVRIVFEATPAGQSVEVGVVPFVTVVNIGDLTVRQESAWIDGGGASDPRSDHHGDWLIHADVDASDNVTVDPSVQVNHLDVFGSIAGADQDWAGCVQARPAPFDTNDDPPDRSTPNTLWTPHFWPDYPDCRLRNVSGNEDTGACRPTDPDSLGGPIKWPHQSPSREVVDNYHLVFDREFLLPSEPGFDLYQSYQNAITDSISNNPQPWIDRFGSANLTEDDIRYGYVGAWDSTVSRYVGRYDLAQPLVTSGSHPGGNRGCGAPLLPLTNVRNDVDNAIDAMFRVFDGGTMISEGVMWGLRVLSPGEPFTEGAPYNDGSTRKALIIMSDGSNRITGGNQPGLHVESELTAYGFLATDRLNLKAVGYQHTFDRLDDKTEEACNLARQNDNIEIYTLTITEVSPATIAPILQECATSDAHAFAALIDDTGTDMEAAFAEIAGALVAPYLSR